MRLGLRQRTIRRRERRPGRTRKKVRTAISRRRTHVVRPARPAAHDLAKAKADPLTALKVDLQAHDIGEFDQLLQTLGFEANGKKGSAAVPVVLHGTLAFNGTAAGPIANLDVKGHLVADSVEVKLGTTADVLVDSVVAAGGLASSTYGRSSPAKSDSVSEAPPSRPRSRRRGPAYFTAIRSTSWIFGSDASSLDATSPSAFGISPVRCGM